MVVETNQLSQNLARRHLLFQQISSKKPGLPQPLLQFLLLYLIPFLHEYTIEIMKHSKLKSPFNVSHKKLSQHASDVQVSIKLKLCADKKLKIIKRLLQSIFSKQLLQFILN
ncbi:Hypothetical_protein [Hexamita inflata]|uniref:Hypothetical_protein n=1 Tax=Hexamita inflata TaxID=28002 RepID=A0AA86TM99_9EUKA|nr:Hypothetical protein HINF_LOCUS9240 [Hexamita inflata]